MVGVEVSVGLGEGVKAGGLVAVAGMEVTVAGISIKGVVGTTPVFPELSGETGTIHPQAVSSSTAIKSIPGKAVSLELPEIRFVACPKPFPLLRCSFPSFINILFTNKGLITVLITGSRPSALR
jgi:hypothetical protein